MPEVIERDNSLYKKAYGKWGGRPEGSRPDYDCCCVGVWPNERGSIEHQCRNKRGYGPGLSYCKTHDPASVKAREDKSQAKFRAQYNADRYGWHGKTFFDALQKIADGHNDARGLAQEVIAEFKRGER